MARTISPSLLLTASSLEATTNTPESTNGFQIFWELLDDGVVIEAPVAPSTIQFSVILPQGTEIPFEVGAVDVITNFIAPTNGYGGFKVKAVAVGLSGTEELHVYCRGLN